MKLPFLFVIGFNLIYNLSFSQCHPLLQSYASGFDSIHANNFHFLDQHLSEVKIVGLGEDTHGTSEFTTLAQELFTFLATHHDFKILILETGFGEGQYLNDYIHGKRNDLNDILNHHNSTWRYKTVEFHQFINTLRNYNQSHEHKVYLYGCEMQYVKSDADRVQDYLISVGSNFKVHSFEKHLWQSFTDDELSDLYIHLAQLKKLFKNNKPQFIHKSSEKEYSIAFHHVHVMGQFLTAIHQTFEQRKHDLRDIYIAENIEWILYHQEVTSKAMYWAHNAHVGNWVDNGIVDVAGHHLKKIYGNHYYNIATDFGNGEFYAFSQDWKMETLSHGPLAEKTFTACLQSMGAPNTFLDILSARKDVSLTNFLNSDFTIMSGAGAQIRNSTTEVKALGQAFDAILYLDQTHPIKWAD